MRHLVLALTAGLLLPACNTINQDNYLEKFIKVQCKIYNECYEEDFAEYWDDVDDCVDEGMEGLEGYQEYIEEYYADCEFSSKNAGKCINSYKKVSCEDLESDDYEIDEEACENIWEC